MRKRTYNPWLIIRPFHLVECVLDSIRQQCYITKEELSLQGMGRETMRPQRYKSHNRHSYLRALEAV